MVPPNQNQNQPRSFTPIQVVAIICSLLIGQTLLTSIPTNMRVISNQISTTNQLSDNPAPANTLVGSTSESSSSSSSSSEQQPQQQQQPQPQYVNPFDIPVGAAMALPSIRHQDEKKDKSRGIYGGKGDGKHLGGFTDIDMMGISPAVWKYLVQHWTVQSILDVGCGRGTSTSWFYTHGLRTLCVEGSHDAVEQSMIPDKSLIVEHDYSRGPWWPEQTFDAVWSVEFLEHVNVHNHYNYISTFRKAAILLVTSSHWGGWHHVEVHKDEWWIRKYEAYGFKYDDTLTQQIRKVGMEEHFNKNTTADGTFPVNGESYNAQHVWTSMKVFLNPVVAALPQHAHLFGEFGCFNTRTKGHRECGFPTAGHETGAALETPLEKSYYPYNLTLAQDEDWYQIVKANIPTEPPKTSTELVE
mmetsp:Transcript_10124/g.11359  ORF Transcript_10124/g.11359 Transcript_10124/m.11359 type:complete len:413 (+) Transcript_10124:143-1381(+)